MKRSRIPPLSAKRKLAQEWRREIIAEVTARDGEVCQGQRIPGHRCATYGDRKPLEAHEIIPRSAWPSGWLVASNVVLLCPAAHDWVGDNPDAAEVLGLHGRSWQRPDGHAGMGRG